MDLVSSTSAVDIYAPAKLNLFFEVLSKRPDGYHEIETLMVPISLCDSLRLEPAPEGQITLEARWAAPPAVQRAAGLSGLPPPEENLVTRAVLLLAQRAGVRKGARMQLTKRIPAAAGLGGGSSDAASALVAANRLWGLGWSTAELSAIAAELGSDVPFFLARGPAICLGRGERVQPLGRLPALHFVVVRPPAGLSTADVYRACRAAERPRKVAGLVDAITAGRQRGLDQLIHNRLQPAAQRLSPWIERLAREFEATSCLAARMSGSGTAYFAVCRHAAHARAVAGYLEQRVVGSIFVVHS